MSKYFLIIALFIGASLPATAAAQDSNKPSDSEQTYLDFQVQTAVRIKTQTAPQYPDHLRSTRVEGSVLVQFVVDEAGTPVMTTFKVLRSTDAAFSESVRRAVSNSAFYPAELKGKKVKQVVQQPYKFATTSK